MFTVLSTFLTVLTAAVASYSVYDIISTGVWKNWGLLDWVCQIAMTVLAFHPFLKAWSASRLASASVGGGIMAKLAKVPLISSIVAFLMEQTYGFRMFFYRILHPLFRKGGFLYELGQNSKTLVNAIGKRPWLIAGLFFMSSMMDGIFQHIYQLWGDIAMRAADVVFEQADKIMNDKGWGNPIVESIQILDGSRSSLPPCFTAIWGAVGASECIGLVITTFHYLFLMAALSQGYKLYGGGKKS